MPKRDTVVFYSEGLTTYHGWQYVNKTTWREVRNWLRSGNEVMVGPDRVILTSADQDSDIRKYFKR